MAIDHVMSARFDEILRMDQVNMDAEIQRLSPAERAAFELFRHIAKDVDNLQSSKSSEKILITNLNSLSDTYFKRRNLKVGRNSKKFVAMAASLVVLLVAVFLLKIYIGRTYSNEAILAKLNIADKITYRSENTANANTLDAQTLDILLHKTDANPVEVFALIHYFSSKNDQSSVLEQNEKLLNFGDLYIHEYYNNKIVAYLKMGDRTSAIHWARRAIEDKKINNNYIFLEIYSKLTNPLAKFQIFNRIN